MPSTSSAAQRFVLFQSLYDTSQSADNDWEQLIALLSKGQQAAQRAQLSQLEEQFTSGQQILLEELREGGVFLDWELRFMQLGLAVGNLGRIYLRLAEHYRLLSDFYLRLKRRFWIPLLLYSALAIGLPVLLSAVKGITWTRLVELQMLGLAPLVFGAAVYALLRHSASLQQAGTALLYRLPGLGLALAQYQSYHFINHLSECLNAGFSMNQALRQSARRLPDSPVKPRFLRLASEVERGERFSMALLNSGVLRGIELPAVPAGADAREVPARLSLAIHQVCERQLQFWSRSLPLLLLGLLPYVLIINAAFLMW